MRRMALTGSRSVRRVGRIATTIAVVVLAIGIPAWVRGFQIQADLTSHRKLTLTAESKRILERVDKRLDVVAFFPQGSVESVVFRDLLAQYQRRNSHVRVRVVDPDDNPGLAAQYRVEAYGSVYFDYGKRRSQANVTAEIEISSAILRVTRGEAKRACFLVGHGEVELGDDGPAGLSKLGQLLVINNLIPVEMPLASDPARLEGCAVLVVPGPATNLLSSEREVMTRWIRDNGKLLVLADPSSDADLRSLIEPYGISPRSELVLDSGSALPGDPSAMLVRNFPSSNPTTREVSQLLLAEVGSVTILGNDRDGLTVSPLATGSADARLIERRSATGSVATPQPADRPVLAAAADLSAVRGSGSEASIDRTRVVWVGDSDFATNALIDELSNSQFLLNTLDWLTLDEDLIGIGAPPIDLRRLLLSRQESDQVFIGMVIALPMLILGIGGVTRLIARRRDLGSGGGQSGEERSVTLG